MKAIAFDTLAYANKLMTAGFTREQAEVQAEAIAELINDNLAAKRNLQELEYRLLLKIGTMIAASVGLVTALVKLL